MVVTTFATGWWVMGQCVSSYKLFKSLNYRMLIVGKHPIYVLFQNNFNQYNIFQCWFAVSLLMQFTCQFVITCTFDCSLLSYSWHFEHSLVPVGFMLSSNWMCRMCSILGQQFPLLLGNSHVLLNTIDSLDQIQISIKSKPN